MSGMHIELFGALLAAVGAALAAAPQDERRLLAEAIERYAERFPSAFSNPRSTDAARFLRELFGEITDAVDARPADLHRPAEALSTGLSSSGAVACGAFRLRA